MPKFNANSAGITYLFGGGFDESVIKLTISDVSLDPRKITAALHKRPTRAFRKGDLSENKKRIMKNGMWQLATPWISKLDFERNLARFLSRLPPEGKVWDQLGAKYDCCIAIILRMRTWNRGGEISANAIRRLAVRGLKLELDVYFDDDAKLWSGKRRSKKRQKPRRKPS